MSDGKVVVDEVDPEAPFMERITLPLSRRYSHKLEKRLLRAQRNGGATRAILKNHAPMRSL